MMNVDSIPENEKLVTKVEFIWGTNQVQWAVNPALISISTSSTI